MRSSLPNEIARLEYVGITVHKSRLCSTAWNFKAKFYDGHASCTQQSFLHVLLACDVTKLSLLQWFHVLVTLAWNNHAAKLAYVVQMKGTILQLLCPPSAISTLQVFSRFENLFSALSITPMSQVRLSTAAFSEFDDRLRIWVVLVIGIQHSPKLYDPLGSILANYETKFIRQ